MTALGWRSHHDPRIDRWATELPPPSDPDPATGGVRTPFYDLIANIAAKEYGHTELVAAAINTMLTGADG